MTERTGGSDVSQTETRAEHKPDASETAMGGEEARLGPWSISGFKWFSSATDSQMTILLAKTPKGALSAFFAPMRRGVGGSVDSQGQLNGVRIQRLKDKVGTRSLPTAELVLEDMRAWMIGEEGHGVQEVRTILAITRVHSAVAAVGYVGRGLSIARAYARVRDISEGKGRRTKLTDSVLHMHTLSDMFVQYRGMMMLTIFTSYVLGLSEHNSDGRAMAGGKTKVLDALTPPQEHVAGLIRILTQLTKAYVCQESVSILFSCMEALGGVGYLNNAEQEHLNISRLWRDCAVLPIWEGTTNVLCTDFIKTVTHPAAGKETLDALTSFVREAAAFQGPGHANLPAWNPVQRWDVIERRLLSESPEELMRNARDHVWQTAQLLASLLLYADAQTDGDPVACDVHKRFAQCSSIGLDSGLMTSPETSLGMDSAIVYGGGSVHHGRPRL
jgi:alkylation response protein AidB-like acyl-CoA dehydrogenase